MLLQLLGGIARLEIASRKNDAAGLSEAKGYLTKAAAGPKSNATILAALMLAETEALGSRKNEEERIKLHLHQVITEDL